MKANTKTKILTFYTDTHAPLLKVFMDTLSEVDKGNLDVIVRKHKQECASGEFASEGWNISTQRKIEFILEYMENGISDGESFIFADADIQFFQSPGKFIHKALDGKDIVFQNDYYGHACTGFFYCRNERWVRDFFYDVLEDIPNNRDDQDTTNKLLKTSPTIKYGLLPPQFFTWGMFYNHWHGETEFPIPDNIVMHHSNWVIGIDKKLELIKAVRNVYNKKSQ